MFDSLTLLPETILRSCIVYIILIFAFRLVGKRHISQLSLLDFVLILLVSNVVQNAMVGNDESLLGGVTAAIALIALNFLFTTLIFKSSKFEKLIEGEPTLLIRHGQPLEGHLRHEQINLQELEEAVREHGIPDIRHVKTAILELDGSISCIPYDEDHHHPEKHLPPLKRRWRGRHPL